MTNFDKLPKEQRDIVNEYGRNGLLALKNAAVNGTPIETVKKELKKLREQNRI